MQKYLVNWPAQQNCVESHSPEAFHSQNPHLGIHLFFIKKPFICFPTWIHSWLRLYILCRLNKLSFVKKVTYSIRLMKYMGDTIIPFLPIQCDWQPWCCRFLVQRLASVVHGSILLATNVDPASFLLMLIAWGALLLLESLPLSASLLLLAAWRDVLPGGGTHRKGDQIWTRLKAQGGEDMSI